MTDDERSSAVIASAAEWIASDETTVVADTLAYASEALVVVVFESTEGPSVVVGLADTAGGERTRRLKGAVQFVSRTATAVSRQSPVVGREDGGRDRQGCTSD